MRLSPAPTWFATGICFVVLFFMAADTAYAARIINSVTLDGGITTTVAPVETISAVIDVTTTGNGANRRWRSTAWRIDGTPPGTTTCVDHANYNSSGTFSETFNIIAPTTPGTYNAYFIAYRNDRCSQGASSTYSMMNAVTVSGAVGVVANYTFDELSWDGTVAEVNDSSGNSHHATATNGPTTANVSPAIPGTPGTCSYGVFDGVDDYIALPVSMPNLNTDFTITAWIRTTDNTRSGQRILIDDQNNTQGFGFSLGDGGTGRVRFFSRSTSLISLDTPNVVGNNNWYFVAAVADITNAAKRIYVFDQAGNQLAAVADTFSGSWGVDNGTASIGGENDASGESGSNFHFVGNIDEVVVHAGALTAAQIALVQNTTRACVSGCLTTNFRDDFSSATFSNQDGSENWSDNWIEYDFSATGASSGHVSISGGELVLTNVPESQNYPGVVREADLSSFDTATLSFSFSTQGNVDRADSLLVKVSPNGGVTWTTLEDITGIRDVSNQQRSYDITAYMSSNTQISLRFNNEADSGSTACCYGAPGEEILFDYVDIEVEDCTPAAIDHLRIEHSASGLTCQRSEVTVRACEDAGCTVEYADPVTVTLSPASANPPVWIGGDTRTFSGGSATFQLRQTTPATLTLGLDSLSPTPANSTVCYSGGSPSSCEIEFFDTGFVFDVPDLTSCRTSSAISIQAVRADAATQTCVADGGFASVSKTVNFWSSYGNPNSGTEQVSLNGTTIATNSPGTGIALNFDTSATASFTVNYPDAGQLQLDARYDGVGAEEAGLVMLGDDSFVSRPVGLCIYSADADADCAAGNGSCSEFKKVDESFNLTVKAVCWESPGDSDFCSGNQTTQNFALNSIPITHTLVAPITLGSSSGSIGVSSIDLVAADSGEHIISNQTVSEVGVFTFSASPPDYFSSTLPVATSTNIGRFTPAHFVTAVTADGTLNNACSGFTYSGQSFGYDPLDRPIMTITATGSSGSTTVNYRDDFVKLSDPTTQINMPAVTADGSNLGADLATLLALSWTPAASNLTRNDDGTLTFTLGADRFTYTRDSNALVSPFNSDIQLAVSSIVDGDGIGATDLPRLFAPSSIEVRYGQLLLQNAYGPETLPLTLSLSAEYFNGSSFVTNSLDSCTPYDVLHLNLANYEGNLASGDTLPAGSGILTAGLGIGMSLSAPGVGNDGSVGLTLDLSQASGADLEWLLPAGSNPTGRATFGIYKGNERLIYMRESVQ